MPVLPRIGERFGRYRIDSQIGRGGMGVVYGATDTHFDRVVALKVVSAGLGDAEEFRRRFEREAAVLARIESPHIIEIFDYGVEDDCPYIATQYVAGGDLGALIRARGAMPPRLALDVCAQVADALGDAHRVGVVHRDVKPGNVLLRDADAPEPHAYLCDFGVARTLTDGLTTPGSVTGTWSYLAPECGRGEPGTPASDIYALGCLLWVALTGAPPYRGADIEIAVAHQQGDIPQLQGDDEGTRLLNQVLARSLAKASADRYADADEFRSAMLDAAGITPTVITPVPATGPGSGLPRGSRGAGSVAPTGTTNRVSGGPAGSASGSGPGLPPPFGTPTPSGAGSVEAAGSSGPWGPSGSGSHHSFGTLPPGTPPSPPRKRRTALIVAAAAVAVLLVAGGVFGVTRLGGGGSGPGPGGQSTGTTAKGPILGDLNHDGLGDLIVEYHHAVKNKHDTLVKIVDTGYWHSDGHKFVPAGTTEGTLYPSGDLHPLPDLRGDFDGDGINDVLHLGYVRKPANHLLLTGTFSGGATLHQIIDGSATGSILASVGDVDGDGKDDIVAVAFSNQHQKVTKILTSLSTGTSFGAFQPAGQLTGDNDAKIIVTGDYDGDGKADLGVLTDVKLDNDLNEVAKLVIHRGDGTSFATGGPQETFHIACCVRNATRGDLDGDGADEFVMMDNSDTHTVRAVSLHDDALGDPRTIGAFTGLNGYGLTFDMGATDVNGDGLDDIVAVGERGPHKAVIKVGLASTMAPSTSTDTPSDIESSGSPGAEASSDATTGTSGTPAASDIAPLTISKWATWKRQFQTGAKYADKGTYEYFSVPTNIP